MPCWEQNLISVDLKAADQATLHAALEALGLTFTESKNALSIITPAGPITVRGGQAEFYNDGCQSWVNKIKQAYSLKTVERIAKRFKFSVTPKEGNKLVLRRY